MNPEQDFAADADVHCPECGWEGNARDAELAEVEVDGRNETAVLCPDCETAVLE